MGLEELAKVVAAQGEQEWAAQLFGAAEALRETMEAPLPPIERPDHEQRIEAVRAALGTDRFRAAWEQGCLMTPWDAFTARQEEGPGAVFPLQPDTGSSPSPLGIAGSMQPGSTAARLTKRELDVLRLLVQGLTNAQIAEQLVISQLTVNAHARAIYRKLDVSSRMQAARYAQDHHLL